MEYTIKQNYDYILKSGLFWEWFPELTGNWDEDMLYFIEYYITKVNH